MKIFHERVKINLRIIYAFTCLLSLNLLFSVNAKMDMFKEITKSCGSFSTDLLQALVKEEKKENVVISPLSLHVILSVLLNGANADTRQEIEDALYVSDLPQLQKELKQLITHLNEASKAELKMANALYIDGKFSLEEEFLNKSKENFLTDIKQINNKLSDESAQKINDWVKEKTNGKITDIIAPKDIDEYTRVIVLNALYFKNNWLNIFDKKFTDEKIFYNIDKEVTYVPTMYKTFNTPYGYIESLKVTFIKLKYEDSQFEMIILLPDEKYGLDDVISKFKWDIMCRAHQSTKEVEVSLPKFKIEATLNLKKVLPKLGLNLIFEERANFSFLSKEPLYVDQVIQKLFIEVDEQGSEAAAASAAKVRSRRMLTESEIFVVDHPFMFILYHVPSSIPLFSGVIRQLGDPLRKDEL